MRTIARLGVAVIFVAVYTAVSTAPAAGVQLWLDKVGDQPVVFTSAASGLSVTLSRISYDGFGRVAEYDIAVTRGSSKSAVHVRAVSGGDGSKYEALSGALRLKNPPGNAGSLIGFMPAEPGGIAARSGLTVRSEFGYDDFGRREVKKQTFSDGGKTYEVSFSNFARDGFGRLTAYAADLRAKP